MDQENSLFKDMAKVGCEVWKPIKGYEGLYEVSNYGNVKSLFNSEKILHPTDNGSGYLTINLRKDGKRKSFYIHRLVASAFVGNPNNVNVVNHLDFNKFNNRASNLEWVTQKENVRYSRHRMRHPKSITNSNTGERYISERNGRYRITIQRKEYSSCATLSEAIRKRDQILLEVANG